MDETVRVRDFLTVSAGAFCDDCLARALDLSREDVKTAIFSQAITFARTYGHCRVCRRPKAVTRTRLVA